MNYKNIPRYNSSKKVDYKKELLKYRKVVVALNSDTRWKKISQNQKSEASYEKFSIPLFSNVDKRILKSTEEMLFDKDVLESETCEIKIIDEDIIKDSVMNLESCFACKEQIEETSLASNTDIENKIMQLDQEPMLTFQEEYGIEEEMDLFEQDAFLYHGIRHYNQLEIFEKILRAKNILAGKYIDGYYSFDDNCNDGEYVSLICYSDSVEFETFVRNNICFVISPFVEAYKTKHLSCDEWDYMKDKKLPVKNRFSYAWFEYQVKDQISLEQVRAIGISFLYMRLTKGHEVANQYKQQIIDLLGKYSIELPIVDIDCFNSVLYVPSKEKVKNKH